MPAATPPPRDRPHKVRHVTTYARLEQYLQAFAAGHFHLVILVGAGGLAKSRTVRAVLGGKPAAWIEGNATPFGMYAKLYRHRDQFVVIDDVDALYADRSGVRLLKCLCQTEEEKAVAWHSDARSLERQGIPREFTTTSRVIIIANDWKTLNRNVAALQDRGHVLWFEPGAAEVHAQAGGWFDDPEIYDWFAANLHRVREPSLRHYVRAKELKAAGHGLDRGAGRRGREPAGPARRGAAGRRRVSDAPRRGSRRSSSRGAAAGRPSSTTAAGWAERAPPGLGPRRDGARWSHPSARWPPGDRAPRSDAPLSGLRARGAVESETGPRDAERPAGRDGAAFGRSRKPVGPGASSTPRRRPI